MCSRFNTLLFLLLYSVFFGKDLFLFAQKFNLCPFDAVVLFKTDPNALPSPKYNVESNTKECESQIPQNFSLFPKCGQDVLIPIFSIVNKITTTENILPYINLNITTQINVPSTQVFYQFECILAPDFEDSYCHNHSTQLKNWGRMIWPCRLLKLSHSEESTPFSFTYSCFRMFGLSQYRVNITLVPQNCRMSYLVTIPRYPQVDFDIRKFYNRSSRLPTTSWSPLVVVDTNSDEAVYINFYRPSYMLHVEMTISIFQRFEKRLKEMLSAKMAAPKSSYKWSDVHAGDYTVFVYIDGPHCDLDCGDKAFCQNCPNTMLNFTVHENKFTHPYSFWNFLANVGKILAILLLGLLILSAFVILGVLVYYRIIRPKNLARRPPRNIELTDQPSVLILYTDDCAEHSKVVIEIANLLRVHANANVFIDQTDLIDPSVKPSLWLMNKISDSQFILLIFSEATKRIISGEQLAQRRPFPDLFSTAITVVISRINELTSSQPVISTDLSLERTLLDRFIVSRVSYSASQVVPEFFSLLKCPHFVLPDKIGFLFGHLHGIRASDGHIEHQANLTELNNAMENYKKFVDENPEWLEERFIQQEELEVGTKIAERLPLNPIKEVVSHEDQMAQAEAYGLLPPDEEEIEDHDQKVNKYKLVGSMDDISTSSSGS